MAEAINWQEKYVSYVEGDLQKDSQKLEDGQKALDNKIEVRVQELKEGQKALNTKVESEITRLRSEDIQDLKDGQKELRSEIKELGNKVDTKVDGLRKELGGKIDRILYIIAGAAAVAVIGGLVKLFIG